MADTIVGIDFSINSPGICIKEDGVYKYFGLVRKDYKLSKANKAIVERFNTTEENITTVWLENHPTSSIYHEREMLNLKDAIYETQTIINLIFNNIDLKNRIYIGIEGLSFGSQGNRLSEISGYQFILRSEVYKLLQEFYIFSPMTVKKVAGKGNLKKEGILKAFLEANAMQNQTDIFISLMKKETLIHPFEDMIDSFWIVKALEKNILNK